MYELTGDEPDLKLGDDGEGVMMLQVRLYALGIYQNVPDGTFDLVTESAVRDVQSALGQDTTGEVTRDTWEAIVYWEQQYELPYQYDSPYDALAQIQYDREHPSTASGQYATEYGTYSEDGQWRWDGSAWQPTGGAQQPADSHFGQLSEDGQWRWDGSAWQPAEGDSYIGQLSEDGRWRWDGHQWQAA